MVVPIQALDETLAKRSLLRQVWPKNTRKAHSVYEYISALNGFFDQDWPTMGVSICKGNKSPHPLSDLRIGKNEPRLSEKSTKKRSIHGVCEHFEEIFRSRLAIIANSPGGADQLLAF